MSAPRRLVSVGIPTYNGLDRLSSAVESVLAQDHPDIELVISDNASTDGTEAYGRQLEAEHPGRVRYLRNDRNLGPIVNFNRARAACTGEFVMWLGDDDRLGPGYLSACVALLDARPDAIVACGTVHMIDVDGTDRPGNVIVCDQPDGRDRVLSYYRQVGDNSSLYGVTRGTAARAVTPLASVMGTDLFLMAELAQAGPLLQTEAVEMWRHSGGASRSLKHAARTLGLSWFVGEFPQLAITWLGFREVAWASPAYAGLTRMARWSLGARVGAIACRRFIVPAVPRYGRLLGRRIRGGNGA